ncbi:MAG: flagellar hook-length control protein FliK [Steroidobacteraceae bacterium]|nr:flagellar hook-length control protein FliK [Nevskiaceae bacterium]MCP5339088.1 flagellar hook-length control protein FliK [Nevskiaceae bacterium]MCP5359997.1 flagellar hook-length control protein FliK [Nevskiaceae bacterium]MCP5466927.1 flagellar hook-length control protein FliK [Nevskiaceae bacterium]MCP5472183.1 flagellar hook-length control protein FliK [Nevskiaceae bacterium]
MTSTTGIASRTTGSTRGSAGSTATEDRGSFAGILESQSTSGSQESRSIDSDHHEAVALDDTVDAAGVSGNEAAAASCIDPTGATDALPDLAGLPLIAPVEMPLRSAASDEALEEALEDGLEHVADSLADRMESAARIDRDGGVRGLQDPLAGLESAVRTEGAGGTGGGETPTVAAAGEIRGGTRSTGSEIAAPARPAELRAPPGTPAWNDELGTQLVWMVERGEQIASLRLNPDNLGPLEVRIAVREGETTVWFGASHADTRNAIEQSLPRLRELLGASGLLLANAEVFSHTPRDPQRGFTAAALTRASQESGADAGEDPVTSVTRRGLIDLYA